MISTMVVAIVNTLMLSINENKAFLCIKKLSFRAHVKKVSASIVTTFARFRKKVKNSAPISKAEIQTLRQRMDSFKVDLRELKSIRDDDPNDVFVQFNIINRETLLAAQREPDKYRNLIVRIAGYSAYFVDLSPAQQAEIIARTEERVA